VQDGDIEILSEEDELSGLAIEAEPEAPDAIDGITVLEEGANHKECPSCGADVDAGVTACPVCEYPLE